MTNLLISLVALMAKRAKADLVQKTYRAPETQAAFLRSLLRLHQDTELGREFHLAAITNVAEFREQVPILPYSNYQPYFERAAAGERNVVTPDPLIYVNLSSGSTNRQKMVPVTRRSKRAVERANQAAIGFLAEAAEQRQLPLGKMLMTASARTMGRTSGGIDYGHVSGGSLRLSGTLHRQIFTQPFEAMLISDSLARNYVCLLFALRNAHLATIAATFPLLALQLCDYLERYAESLIADLERGQIADGLQIDPVLRSKLQQQLPASPHRAAQLRQLLETSGRLTPQAAWPHLSFVITARGGTSDFYFERFPDYFGDTPIFGGTYASSEATFGAHHDFNTDGTVLALDSGFFEFIPPEEWDAEQPKTLLPHEVQVGELYRILITNYSGFYRYDIGDVVEVVGFYNQAPLIVFRYRQGGTLSATTEKTTEYHAIQIMQALQQQYNLVLEDFCVTLSEDMLHPYYVLNIELPVGQHLSDPQSFLVDFDRQVQAANASYAVKRQNQDIRDPMLRILASGSFAILRQRQLRPGVANTQMKFSHISDDRTLLDGLVLEQVVSFPGQSHPVAAVHYRTGQDQAVFR